MNNSAYKLISKAENWIKALSRNLFYNIFNKQVHESIFSIFLTE